MSTNLIEKNQKKLANELTTSNSTSMLKTLLEILQGKVVSDFERRFKQFTKGFSAAANYDYVFVKTAKGEFLFIGFTYPKDPRKLKALSPAAQQLKDLFDHNAVKGFAYGRIKCKEKSSKELVFSINPQRSKYDGKVKSTTILEDLQAFSQLENILANGNRAIAFNPSTDKTDTTENNLKTTYQKWVKDLYALSSQSIIGNAENFMEMRSILDDGIQLKGQLVVHKPDKVEDLNNHFKSFYNTLSKKLTQQHDDFIADTSDKSDTENTKRYRQWIDDLEIHETNASLVAQILEDKMKTAGIEEHTLSEQINEYIKEVYVFLSNTKDKPVSIKQVRSEIKTSGIVLRDREIEGELLWEDLTNQAEYLVDTANMLTEFMNDVDEDSISKELANAIKDLNTARAELFKTIGNYLKDHIESILKEYQYFETVKALADKIKELNKELKQTEKMDQAFNQFDQAVERFLKLSVNHAGLAKLRRTIIILQKRVEGFVNKIDDLPKILKKWFQAYIYNAHKADVALLEVTEKAENLQMTEQEEWDDIIEKGSKLEQSLLARWDKSQDTLSKIQTGLQKWIQAFLSI